MSGASKPVEPPRCELCGRATSDLTRHHLIPRTRHSNRHNQREFSREDVRSRLAMLCVACHKQVHATLSEKQLEREFNTLEALRSHPGLSRFISWVKRQPAGSHITVRNAGGKGTR